MAFRIEISELAAAEIDIVYFSLAGQSPRWAQRWYVGLMARLDDLREFPRRYPRVALSPEYSQVSRFLYGRGRNKYRVVFAIDETIRVLRVRHAARGTGR